MTHSSYCHNRHNEDWNKSNFTSAPRWTIWVSKSCYFQEPSQKYANFKSAAQVWNKFSLPQWFQRRRKSVCKSFTWMNAKKSVRKHCASWWDRSEWQSCGWWTSPQPDWAAKWLRPWPKTRTWSRTCWTWSQTTASTPKANNCNPTQSPPAYSVQSSNPNPSSCLILMNSPATPSSWKWMNLNSQMNHLRSKKSSPPIT